MGKQNFQRRRQGGGNGNNRRNGGVQKRNSKSSASIKDSGVHPGMKGLMFTIDEKDSADVLKTGLSKMCDIFGSSGGQDIGTELYTRKYTVLKEPEYSKEQLEAHQESENRRKNQLNRLIVAYETKNTILEKRLNKAKLADATDEDKLEAAEASIVMAELLTKIEDAKHINQRHRTTSDPAAL